MSYGVTHDQRMAEASKAARMHPATPRSVAAARPRLTADSAIEYLDWLTANLHAIDKEVAQIHMAAAELVIRVHMGDAQGKATAHSDGLAE